MQFQKIEKESILNFNEQEDLCRVYTRSKGFAGELKKLGYSSKKTILNQDDSFRSEEFEIPKDKIKVLPKKG